MADVTQILSQIEQGDQQAAEQLLPLVYDELRRLAAVKLASEKPGQTLQATALVHEAYLRLLGAGSNEIAWNSRGHFFCAAAEAMRRILVENARRKLRIRHGGNRNKIELDQFKIADFTQPSDDLLALSDALTLLQEEQPEAAEIVKLRYFAGLTIEQAAAAINVSVRTANRHWAYAKAWLFQRIS